jgi:hypothetical protein
MTKRSQPTDAQIITALQASAGIMTAAARALGMERSSLWRRVSKSAKLTAGLQEARESVLDLAESSLLKGLQRGDPWATCFYLKCLGKHRGYVERQEVTGPNGGRKVYGLEITPGYCAVILQRMADAFPGIKIQREE